MVIKFYKMNTNNTFITLRINKCKYIKNILILYIFERYKQDFLDF